MEQAGDALVTGPGGIELVKLNQKKVWTKKIRIIQQAQRNQEQAHGDALNDDVGLDRFRQMSHSVSEHDVGSGVLSACYY